jgi:ankyrin repeat protein
VDNRARILLEAANQGNTEKVTALLQAGEIPADIQDDFERTALHYVAFCKAWTAKSCARVLLQDAKLHSKRDQQDTLGDTPLLIAARSGSPAIYALLEAKLQSINQPNNKGHTVFFYIANFKNFSQTDGKKLTSILIQAGAEVNLEDKYTDTPLDYVIHYSNLPVMIALLQAGAQIRNKAAMFESLYKADHTDFETYYTFKKLEDAYAQATLEEKPIKDKPLTLSRWNRPLFEDHLKKLRQLYPHYALEDALEKEIGMARPVAQIVAEYTQVIRFFKPFSGKAIDEIVKTPENFLSPTL